jgi:hypothetical protein
MVRAQVCQIINRSSLICPNLRKYTSDKEQFDFEMISWLRLKQWQHHDSIPPRYGHQQRHDIPGGVLKVFHQ